MNQSDLLYISAQVVIAFAVVLFSGVVCLKRYRLIKWENATESKKKWVKKYENKLNNICFVILLVMSLIALKIRIVPYVLDIPYIIEGNYSIITGRAKQKDHGGADTREVREIEIVDKKGNVENISFFGEYIDEGEKVTVVYLPYSKFGTRLQ